MCVRTVITSVHVFPFSYRPCTVGVSVSVSVSVACDGRVSCDSRLEYTSYVRVYCTNK